MRKFIKFSFLLAIFALVSSSVQAQKFGFIDRDAIVADLDSYKNAMANLKVFEQQLTNQLKGLQDEIQTKLVQLEDRKQKGTITQQDYQKEYTKLEEKGAKLQKDQADAVQQFQAREEKELQPIIDSINGAITAVAKENGFQFIFEKKMLLYFDNALDVSDQVKAKLK